MADECINQSTPYIVSSGSIALLRGRVASILHRFQFVIIPLSVDCGIFSKEISAGQVASYPGSSLEFAELLKGIHSFTNVRRSTLHA